MSELDNIKNADIREQIKQEYRRCATDPIFFMKKYCKIQHPQRGTLLFKLFKYQEDLIKDLLNFDYNIVLKSRQLGISTVGAGYALWLMTFHSDKNVLIIATKQDIAKNLVSKIRFMYKNLPSWLREDFVEDNRLSLKFKNGSQVKAESSSTSAGRSESLSCLLIDEGAFIDNAETIWTAAQQTLSTGGQALIMSTPNGQGNWFHKMWVEAEEGTNGFNTVRLPWYVHPERDDAWRAKQDKLLGVKDAAQECIDGEQYVEIASNILYPIKLKLKDLYTIFANSKEKLWIKTPSGYQRFKGITKRTKDKYLQFTLSNSDVIKTSYNHIWISNGQEIFAKDLKSNDIVDSIDDKIITINDIEPFYEFIDLYDIIGVEDGNLFILNNDVIIHNCDTDFTTSGATVINATDLEYYKKNFITEPIDKLGTEQEYWVWEQAKDGHTYITVADVARGDGGDYSAFHILDVLDNGLLVQVAEFRAKIPVDEFAQLLSTISTKYNKALLIVENANVGWAVLSKLINDIKYPNLYYTHKSNPFTDIATQVRKGYDLKDNAELVAGFSTTSATRLVMIEKLEEYVREKTIVLQSRRTLNELYTFIWKDGRPEAMGGYNDDLVMSLAIGVWVRETALRMRQYGLNLTRSSINGIRRTGVYRTNPYESGAKEYWNLNNTQVKTKEDADLRWLR